MLQNCLKQKCNKKVIFLTGPTGIGKTEISLELAKRRNFEIICCDSMQVYKGMDIISCKVPKIIREKIPHHLIDIVSPEEEFNVFRWVDLALKKIREIHRRKKIPLVVGGSMLYLSCLLDGIFSEGKTDKSIRDSLYREAERFGKDLLYKRLERVDPVSARKIHPNDIRRTIRALEVYEIYKRPISLLQKEREPITNKYDVKIFGLIRPMKKLYQRIDTRVKKMFRRGLVDEVKDLLKLKLSKTAAQVIGIKEIKGYLEGKYDLEEAMRLISKNTRNYARRQMSWLRKDKRIEQINIDEDESQIIYNLANQI